MVQLYTDFFSIVNTTVPHNPRFVDCTDGEMKIRRAINRLCTDFLLCRGLESPASTLFKGQLYIRNPFNSIAKRIQLDLKKEDLPTPFTLPSPKVPSKPTSLLFLLWYSLFVGGVFFVFCFLFCLNLLSSFNYFQGFVFSSPYLANGIMLFFSLGVL